MNKTRQLSLRLTLGQNETRNTMKSYDNTMKTMKNGQQIKNPLEHQPGDCLGAPELPQVLMTFAMLRLLGDEDLSFFGDIGEFLQKNADTPRITI